MFTLLYCLRNACDMTTYIVNACTICIYAFTDERFFLYVVIPPSKKNTVKPAKTNVCCWTDSLLVL